MRRKVHLKSRCAGSLRAMAIFCTTYVVYALVSTVWHNAVCRVVALKQTELTFGCHIKCARFGPPRYFSLFDWNVAHYFHSRFLSFITVSTHWELVLCCAQLIILSFERSCNVLIAVENTYWPLIKIKPNNSNMRSVYHIALEIVISILIFAVA